MNIAASAQCSVNMWCTMHNAHVLCNVQCFTTILKFTPPHSHIFPGAALRVDI